MKSGTSFAPLPDDFFDLCGGIAVVFLGLAAIVVACGLFVAMAMR